MADDFSLLVEDEPDRTIPEDRIVRGRLIDLKRESVPYIDKQSGESKTFDKLIWTFEVTALGVAWEGRKVLGNTSARFTNHPNNRARNWAEALLRRPLPVNNAVSRSDLVGLPCEFTVRHEPDRKDPHKFWERIDEVLPFGGAQSDAPPF